MIRIKHEGIYTIEVNEQGDTIEFNVQDPNFFDKLFEFQAGMTQINEDLVKAEKEAIKQSNIEVNGVSPRDRFYIQSMKDYFNSGREVVDNFFGENASNKIFGIYNSLDMFYQFTEQLDTHFEKAGVNFQQQIKDIQAKYQVEDEEVL